MDKSLGPSTPSVRHSSHTALEAQHHAHEDELEGVVVEEATTGRLDMTKREPTEKATDTTQPSHTNTQNTR